MTVKRGLVLGCGGVAGGAWEVATLHALQQQLDWDVREAEVIAGTSVGAVLAALLGAGVSVDRMLASQQGQLNSECDWQHDRDYGGALPPRPQWRATARGLLLKGLKGEVPPLTAVCGAAPTGRFDMTPFRRLIDNAVAPADWPGHPNTWIMAVDTRNGERVAFGKEDAPQAHIVDAVCASYGIPGWCPPINIGSKTYIDGGVASPTSADFLAATPVDEVVVLAPMAASQMDRPFSPLARIERRIRKIMTAIVDKEIAVLKAAGKRVVRLEPGPEDLKAFGYNMMDPARRRQVLATALKTAPGLTAAALAANT